MAVTNDDVRRVAELARLGVDEARLPRLVAELDGILAHMAVLEKVDVEGVEAAAGISSGGMPLRVDAGPQYPLAVSRDSFAPVCREGFFVVPRLDSHAALGGSGEAATTADDAA